MSKATETFDLNRVGVANPCSASWADMEGDDVVRHCEQCDLNVYNLSGMKRDAAESLVQKMEGRLCVRFFQRADGTLITQDCPVALAALRRRLAAWTASVAALLALVLGLFGWRAAEAVTVQGRMLPVVQNPTPTVEEPVELMGDVCVVEPQRLEPQEPEEMLGGMSYERFEGR